MRLNHLDLTVANVSESRAFFEKYFGLRCIVSVDRVNDELAPLTDEAGFALTLNNLDKTTLVEYPGGFHVGFMQDSPERVDELHRRLVSDGFDIESPRLHHGAWTFFFRAPGGFVIEIRHQFMRGDDWGSIRSTNLEGAVQSREPAHHA